MSAHDVITAALIAGSAPLVGIGRRIAGGLFGDLFGWILGDTPVRAFFAATGAAALLAGGAVWWMAAIGAVSVFAGATSGNFGAAAMGHGRTGFWHDFAWLIPHGLAHAALLAAAMAVAGHGVWWLPLAGGALISPCYVLGWSLPASWNWRGLGVGMPASELIWGTAFGLSLALSGLA